MTPTTILRKLLRTLDQNTPATLLARLITRKPTAEPATAPPPPNQPHPFDLAHHVETSGFHSGDTLAQGLFHTDYYGIAPSALAQALDHLGTHLASQNLAWSQFTFLDLGSGKGRALLVASRHPFESILGVELSAQLCEIARTNLQTFSAPWQQCHTLEVLQGDATQLPLPQTPLVLFLYHPFLAPVLRRVLRNLQQSLRQNPRPIYLLYANPTYERILARHPFLTLLWHYTLPLSAEDAAACQLQITQERFALYQHPPQSSQVAENPALLKGTASAVP